MRGRAEPLEARFWAKVDTSGECWVWTGSLNRNGYGVIAVNHRHEAAHRTAWRLSGRALDPALTLDHLCRNRRCVRVDHLEQVTMRENLLRGMNHAAIAGRRSTCVHGHLYTDANCLWRITRGGRRYRTCRTCERSRWHTRNVHRFAAEHAE